MNRSVHNCEKCKSSYIVSMDHRHFKKCRVCEAIATEAGVDVENPAVQDLIEKAVAKAYAKAKAEAEADYKKTLEESKRKDLKPVKLPTDA